MDTPLFPNRVPDDPRAMYLDLLRRCLTNWLYADAEASLAPGQPFQPERRRVGKDWPPMAHTMIGVERLSHLQHCAETALREGVPGDFLEAGVWRGGASILLRAVLRAHGVTDRRVWLADSFCGVPAPDLTRYPQDADLRLHQFPFLAVPLEQVQANFARYGLLDEQVVFLKGWFRDTLPSAPVGRLALLRLDGDLYESTMDALVHLYPKVAPGGFVIVDDYGDIAACRQAVADYRRAHGVSEPIQAIDWTGAFWRRTATE